MATTLEIGDLVKVIGPRSTNFEGRVTASFGYTDCTWYDVKSADGKSKTFLDMYLQKVEELCAGKMNCFECEYEGKVTWPVNGHSLECPNCGSFETFRERLINASY